ncbi:hypothetical protein DFH09DRAFT_1097059 [Mycena vulgaris]|nr:hypothetical protein DFH09DRAFT_1097059 [Mycena vulgaris]
MCAVTGIDPRIPAPRPTAHIPPRACIKHRLGSHSAQDRIDAHRGPTAACVVPTGTDVGAWRSVCMWPPRITSSSMGIASLTWSIRARAQAFAAERVTSALQGVRVPSAPRVDDISRSTRGARDRTKNDGGLEYTCAFATELVQGSGHPYVFPSLSPHPILTPFLGARARGRSQKRGRDKFKAWRIRARAHERPWAPVCPLWPTIALLFLRFPEKLSAEGLFLPTSAPSSLTSCCRAATYVLRWPGIDSGRPRTAEPIAWRGE